MRRVCAHGGRARRRHRRPGRLPRPGRLRPPPDRRSGRRADRRRALPARRAGRRSPGWPAAGCATSSRTARSTTPPRPSRAGRRDRRRRSPPTTSRCRCSACPGRRLAARRPSRRAARRWSRRSPTARYLRRRHAWCPARSQARCSPTPKRWRPRAVDYGRPADRFAAVDGSGLAVRRASLCLHGDTPGAVDLAPAVRAGSSDAGIALAAFAR